MDQETKEIFEKMNKQEELRMKLALAIPEILIVDQWKTYSFYLKKSSELLKQSLDNITAQNLGEAVLITTERDARFHLFNFFSYTYCIRQTMFEGKAFSKGSKEFDALVTDWKNEHIVRIIIAVRNKYQHGSLMEHVLHYEGRTEHHADGPGFTVGYNFEPTTWEKIVKEVQGAEAKVYLKKILEEDKANPVSRIIDEFLQSCDTLTASLDELFEKSFVQELLHKKTMKDEYDTIEKWFEDRGMYALKP